MPATLGRHGNAIRLNVRCTLAIRAVETWADASRAVCCIGTSAPVVHDHRSSAGPRTVRWLAGAPALVAVPLLDPALPVDSVLAGVVGAYPGAPFLVGLWGRLVVVPAPKDPVAGLCGAARCSVRCCSALLVRRDAAHSLADVRPLASQPDGAALLPLLFGLGRDLRGDVLPGVAAAWRCRVDSSCNLDPAGDGRVLCVRARLVRSALLRHVRVDRAGIRDRLHSPPSAATRIVDGRTRVHRRSLDRRSLNGGLSAA